MCKSKCRLPRSVSGGGGGIGGDRATFIGNTKVTTINLGLQYCFDNSQIISLISY